MKTEHDILEKFIEEYNSLYNTPNYKVTKRSCEQYRVEHPHEFKATDWSIDRHRKRLMDWISRQTPQTLENLSK